MNFVEPRSWHESEARRPRFGEFNAYRVGHDIDAFLAVDHRGHRHLLLGHPDDVDFIDDRSRGLSVEARRLEVEGHPERCYVDVLCGDAAHHESFTVIVNAILTEVQRGVDAVAAVSGVMARWRRFWGRVPDSGLTADQVRGLFGELWFLLIWLLPRSREHVNYWRGPSGARHDFQWPGMAVEAKATVSVRGHIHRIHGLEQLESPREGQLYFFSLRIREEASASNSLVGVVERITSLLDEEPALLEVFENRLAQAGYSPAHGDRYRSMVFRVVDERLYRVGSGFPRIVAGSLTEEVPRGVEAVAYEINVDSCPDLLVARDPRSLDAVFGAPGPRSPDGEDQAADDTDRDRHD